MRGITRDVSSWYLWDGSVAGGDGRIPFCSKPRAYPEFATATSGLTGARYRFETSRRCEEPARDAPATVVAWRRFECIGKSETTANDV
jgi:hypothetical protein